MGQVSSSPAPHSAVSGFVNLPREAIMNLWLSYNLLGEGWSLNIDQFISIFNESSFLRENYQFTDDQLVNLFNSFDTDDNGLIDALEFLVTIGMLSGMDAIDKVHFAFGAFDFDSRGSLSGDEANLLFRSTSKGLLKASPTTAEFAKVQRDDAERFAELLFSASGVDRDRGRVSLDAFRAYNTAHPVLSNWLRTVSSIELGGDIVAKASLDGDNRVSWARSLARPPVAPSVANTEGEFGEEREELPVELPLVPVVAAAGDDDDGSAATPVPLPEDPLLQIPWCFKADRLKPDEILPARRDTPEELFEAAWVGGITAARLCSNPQPFRQARVPRAARYLGNSGAIVYAAGGSLIVARKTVAEGEDPATGTWGQVLYRENRHPISAMDIYLPGADRSGILATVDCSLDGGRGEGHSLVLWSLTADGSIVNGTARRHIPLPCGARFLDLSAGGQLALIILEDGVGTALVIDLSTGLTIFTRSLLLDCPGDTIYDARFFGSSVMFGVATAFQGLRLFVDEAAPAEPGLLAGAAPPMRLYTERSPIYGSIGQSVKGIAALSLCRLARPDEMAVGSDKGQITLWRGRTVAQVVHDAHRTAVTTLDYCAVDGVLISGAEDGTVRLFELKETDSKGSSSSPSKGPRPVATRSLQLSASYDILRHDQLQSHYLGSLCLSADGSRVLAVTAGNELLELRNRLALPTPEELAEAAEAAEAAAAAAEAGEGESGALPPSKGQLGDDLQGGPITAGHFLPESLADLGVSITGFCKAGGNGFATCGTDGTIRIWGPAGGDAGAAEGAAPYYKALKTIKLDAPCTAITASGISITVALGGKGVRQGLLQLYSYPEGAFLVDLPSEPTKDRSIVDLRMSAEGTLLVAVAEDGTLFVFAQTEGVWALRGQVAGDAHGAIGALDLASDSAFIKAYYPLTKELKVIDISATFGRELFSELVAALEEAKNRPPPQLDEDGQPIGDPLPVPGAAVVEQLKGITWAASTCPHNWDTKGSPLLNDSTSTGAKTFFDRSNLVLLSSQTDGSVSISRAPALTRPETLGSRQLEASAGPLAGLSFLEEGGARLVTVGAMDGSITIWKVTYDPDEPEIDLPDPPADEVDATAAGGDEEGEGKPQLEEVEDSGDEEDVYDLARMKRHLRRSFAITQAKNYTTTDIKSNDAIACVQSWCNALGYSDVAEVVKFTGRAWAESGHANDLSIANPRPPADDLALDWVYGCSSRSTRNAVRYTADGLVLYPAGPLAVVYDKIRKKQLLIPNLSDDITALDLHLPTGIAAISHKGAGIIHVLLFKTSDGSVLRSIEVGIVNAVSALRFSPDGTLLIVACQDEQHTIKLFGVVDGCLLAQVPGGKMKVLSLTFSDLSLPGNSLRILQAGLKHFKVLTYTPSSRTLHTKTGGYGADVRKSHVNAVIALPLIAAEDGSTSGNEFLLGMSDGTLGLIARGESKVNGFNPLLKGPVTAMTLARIKAATSDEPAVFKVIVAGLEGVVKVLDTELQPLQEFNLYKNDDHGLYNVGRLKGVKSLAVDRSNRKILFATSAGEIGEFELATGVDLNDGQPLVTAHFRDELNALCAHPLRQEVLTAGEDRTLRIWSLETHSLLAMLELPGRARAAAFAPNGHLAVVSLTRKEDDPFGGRMAVVSYLQGKLRVVYVASDAKEEIASLLFSPDGSKVYAASLDHAIYVYDALNNFTLLATLTNHTEGIVSLDISLNGKYLVSEGEKSEFLLWDLSTNAAVTRASDVFEVLADIGHQWSVRQNLFGLSSLGIFDVKLKEKTQLLSLSMSHDHTLLATGDCFGGLHLFSNPATSLHAPKKNYQGVHGKGGISRVAFSVDDQFLLTIGRSDRCLLQWKVLRSSQASPDSILPIEEGAAKGTAQEAFSLPSRGPDEDQSFENSFIIKNVDFRMTEANTVEDSVGDYIASLSGLYGLGKDSSASPVLCGQGELLLPQANAVMMIEGDGKRMHVWNTATVVLPAASSPIMPVARGVIIALAATVDGRYVMLGYDSGVLEMYSAPAGLPLSLPSAALTGNKASVSAVAFSRDGHLAAALYADSAHSLTLLYSLSGRWDSNDCQVLQHQAAVSLSGLSLLAFLSPRPTAATTTAQGPTLCAGGKGRIVFWTLSPTTLLLRAETGIYSDNAGQSEVIPVITAVVGGRGNACEGEAITGDENGHVFLWRGKLRSKLLERHDTAITAMTAYGYGLGVSSSTASASQTMAGSASTTGLTLSTHVDGAQAVAPAGFVAASLTQISVWASSTNIMLLHVVPLNSLFGTYALGNAAYGLKASEQIVTGITSDHACRQLLVSINRGSLLLSVAPDSGAVRRIIDGQPVKQVTSAMQLPGKPNVLITGGDDGVLRAWGIGKDPCLTGLVPPATTTASASAKGDVFGNLMGNLVNAQNDPISALAPLTADLLLMAVAEKDANGSSAAVFIVSVDYRVEENQVAFTFMDRLDNIGKGDVIALTVSADLSRVACCSSDGCVYLFAFQSAAHCAEASDSVPGVGRFQPLGFLLAHPSALPVCAIDFSRDLAYARTFGEYRAGVNGLSEVHYFALDRDPVNWSKPIGAGADAAVRRHAGAKITDTAALETIKALGADGWSSFNGPASPELRGLAYDDNNGETRYLQVEGVSVSSDRRFVAAGYDDGTVRVFRFPAVSTTGAASSRSIELRGMHGQGPLRPLFLTGQGTVPQSISGTGEKSYYRLATVGKQDGLISVWNLEI